MRAEYTDEGFLIPKNTSIIVRRVPVTRAVSHIQNVTAQAAASATNRQQKPMSNATSHHAAPTTQSKAALLLGTNSSQANVFGESNTVKTTIEDQEFGGDAMDEAHKLQQEQNQQHKEDELISNMVSQSAMDWRQEVRSASSTHGRGRGLGSGGRGRGRGQLGGEVPPSWYICNRYERSVANTFESFNINCITALSFHPANFAFILIPVSNFK